MTRNPSLRAPDNHPKPRLVRPELPEIVHIWSIWPDMANARLEKRPDQPSRALAPGNSLVYALGERLGARPERLQLDDAAVGVIRIAR